MAELGTVKFYGKVGRDGRPYGMITPDAAKEGSRDVFFDLDKVRIPQVNQMTGEYGWAFPNGVSAKEPQAGDRVVFVRLTNADGTFKAIRWAYEDAHEAALDLLWGLLASRDYRENGKDSN